MADSTLAHMFWSRVDESGALPAHVVKRGGQWLTLTWAEVRGLLVRDQLALSL